MGERQTLEQLWQAAINEVHGAACVLKALQQQPITKPDQIVAVGKAAAAMCQGALKYFGDDISALVVSKDAHIPDTLRQHDQVVALEASHPVPDTRSLKGGQLLLDTVSAMPAQSSLLVLVSGGASALVELLADDMSLEDLKMITAQMLASGQDIEAINARRKQLSRIKGGQLLRHFKGHTVTTLAISDVPASDVATIGSGVGSTHLAEAITKDERLVATNASARQAVAAQAQALGLAVCFNEETLYGDVNTVAQTIADTLADGAPGVYIWGGESTIALPENPGNGGRNQSLALEIARHIKGLEHIHVLVAGTDGTDGPTDAAGGIVDGTTAEDIVALDQALASADAGTLLRKRGDIFITGPTQTNVMDLVIAIVI